MVSKIKFLYQNLSLDEKANVITHGFGLILAILASPFLLNSEVTSSQFFGLCIFSLGMVFMFFSSTIFHLSNKEIWKNRWRLVDHISIFILIGATYTPFILFYYNSAEGIQFLKIHWLIIAFGILFKLIFKTNYEIVSLTLYLVLGWMVLIIFNDITANMSTMVKFFLLAGGICYTIGVYFYVKTHLAWHHAVWHIFVILGCAGHFMALFLS